MVILFLILVAFILFTLVDSLMLLLLGNRTETPAILAAAVLTQLTELVIFLITNIMPYLRHWD